MSINATMTYSSVASFVNYGIVWACIYYVYTQWIVSEAHARRASPEGQHTPAFLSLTPYRMLFVSSTVIGFSRPHMCPEMDQVENANPNRLPRLHPHRHQYSASRSPAASPLTQTPGQKMGSTCPWKADVLLWWILSLHLPFHMLTLQSLFVSGGLTTTLFSHSVLISVYSKKETTPVILTNLVTFK